MKFSIFLMLAAGCGGSSAAQRAAVTGKVAGVAVSATNAAAVRLTVAGKPAVDVFITNAADGCAANDANLKSRQLLSLGVVSLSGAPLGGGNYGVYDQAGGNFPQGNVAFVDWHTSDGACADTTPGNAVGASGRVTVSHIALEGADAGVSGDFDLLLENGDRLKGTFDAPLCAAAVTSDAGCH
jgi:hypothetical protein